MSTPINFSKPINYSALKNKHVLKTGGASGLGEGFVRMFAQAGANVVIADLNQEAGSRIEFELVQSGHKSGQIHPSRRLILVLPNHFRSVLEYFPNNEIDILITSAGVGHSPLNIPPQPPQNLDSDVKAWDVKAIEINLIGTYWTTQLAITYGMGLHLHNHLKHSTADSPPYTKSIILVGSSGAYAGGSGADYTAGKFGIRGLLAEFRRPFAKLGVRLDLLAPFFVETPLTASFIEGVKKMGVVPAEIGDVVGAVVRLAGDGEIVEPVLVHADGIVDLGDDAEGFRGGKALWELKGGIARFVHGDLADQVPAKGVESNFIHDK